MGQGDSYDEGRTLSDARLNTDTAAVSFDDDVVHHCQPLSSSLARLFARRGSPKNEEFTSWSNLAVIATSPETSSATRWIDASGDCNSATTLAYVSGKLGSSVI